MPVTVNTFRDLQERLNNGTTPPLILDVREPDEWDESHLLAATNIPLGDIPSRIKDIPAGEVWVHCRMGGRAGKACDYLRDNRSDLDIHWINEPYTNAALANIPVS